MAGYESTAFKNYPRLFRRKPERENADLVFISAMPYPPAVET